MNGRGATRRGFARLVAMVTAALVLAICAFPSPALAVEAAAPAEAARAALDAGQVFVENIDVGQGDSTLVQLPDGKLMLIDAGPVEAGDEVVRAVRDLGRQDVDVVVATHPHADHIGGMLQVFSNLNVKSVWAPNVVSDTQTFEDFLDAVTAEGLDHINSGTKGETIVSSNAEGRTYSVDIIGPDVEHVPGDDLNAYSLVIEIKAGDKSYLFTGDASADEIRADMLQAEDADGDGLTHVDYLKVAHHGSDMGTDFALMQQLTPEVSVISYGMGNSYGHPTQNTLDALNAVGTSIFGTGADGTVTVMVSADGVSVVGSGTHESTIYAGGVTEEQVQQAEAAVAEETPAATPPADADGDKTVYITDTGKKYHNAGCRYLKKSGHPISESDAIAQGYEPCSVCNP